MSSPTVLAPLPVLSQAFSALQVPTPASLSPSAAPSLARRSAAPSASHRRTVKLDLHLQGPRNAGRQPKDLPKELQVLRRSLTVLLTPPQAFSPVSSSPATSLQDGVAPKQPALPASLQQLYSTVQALVRAGAAEDVWDAVRLSVERGAGALGGAMKASFMTEEIVQGWERWLEVLWQAWGWWTSVTSTLQSILLPLTQLSMTAYQLSPLLDTAISSLFAESSDVQLRTTGALLRAVALRRGAVDIADAQLERPLADVHLLLKAAVCNVLAPLGLLDSLLLNPLKRATQTFYLDFLAEPSSTAATTSASAPIEDDSITSYILLIAAFLRSDELLYKELRLSSPAVTSLLDIPLSTLLSDELLPKILQRGLFTLLAPFSPSAPGVDLKGKTPESPVQRESEHGLEVLAGLARRVGKGTELRGPFGEWVRRQVESVIGDPANDAKMVSALLALRESISSLLQGPLGVSVDGVTKEEDKTLRDASGSAFQTGMGSRKNKPAEMIAKEIDALLRSKVTSSDLVDAKLDSLLTLVRYTRDKDVFRAFYVAALAKRLLLNRSSSEDAELKMVARLKRELGEDFMKGDGMMADLKLSESLMKGYRSKVPAKEDMDLSVNVLSAANWPSYPALDKGWESFALPPTFNAALESFKAYYLAAHQGRVLDWRYQLFQLTLKTSFAGGSKKELGVSLWQALVLMAFEDVDDGATRSFADLQDETGIEREELRRTLQSLACGKERVLVKHPRGRDVHDADVFSFNDGYTSDRYRVKINQVQQGQTKEEDDKTESRVMHDRSHLLDAAIVRIMKAKKRMGWNDLTNAVVDAVRNKFPPEPKAIKLQIESLIEREYLERGDEDESGRKSLTYLA